jgi:hypothetical protein
MEIIHHFFTGTPEMASQACRTDLDFTLAALRLPVHQPWAARGKTVRRTVPLISRAFAIDVVPD